MPYCPKCDMEFIEGITACTDCGGPLVESKEVAMAMKQKVQEEEAERQRAEYEAMMAQMQELEAAETDESGEASAVDDTDSEAFPGTDSRGSMSALGGARRVQPHVYVKKAQKYEDLKSSATAFWLVGGILTAGSALAWGGILNLPLAGTSGIITKTVLTAMGLASLYVGFTSSKSAKEISGQIGAEEETTRQLIAWFTENYSGSQLDDQITAESGELSPEELSLKRFDLIQDIIVTNHDITDQDYVDALAEDIYGKLFED